MKMRRKGREVDHISIMNKVLFILGALQVINAYLICHDSAKHSEYPLWVIILSLVIGMISGYALVAVSAI